MKPRLFAGLALVLVLIISGTPLLAQRPFPPRFEHFGEFFAVPPVPPVPPIPPLPPFPPEPPFPPLPPTPFEHFNFEFEWQGNAGLSSDPEVRLQQEVFRSLLRNSADRGIEVATERLKTNPGDPVVLGNLTSIAASGSTKAQPLLVSIAKTSTNTSARQQAISAIARNREDKDTLTTLEDIYKASADNLEVRRVVVTSIGRMADPRTVTVLASIIRNDTDESIRRSAIRSLGNRQDAESIKVLEELLKQVPRVRG